MQIDIQFFGISGLLAQGYGRLDLESAMEYGSKIKDAIEDSDETITELVLDFSEITFIASYGLKVVLELYKLMQNQGKMKVTNLSEQIFKAFKMVGFDKFLEIE